MICIYRIINLLNGDLYIGSSCNFIKRKAAHLRTLKLNNHHNIILQRAYNKYGKENFIIEPIEVLKNNSHQLKREQFYIDLLKPKYNIAKNTLAPGLGLVHNKETKNKISILHKGNKYNLGRKATEETRLKIKQARLNSIASLETKQKMSETAKRIKSISRINREKQFKKVIDNLGNTFNSLTDASKFHSISVQSVCDILRCRRNKTRKGISFEYA